ncbi:plastocyanin/azurin family copper-binding protein [Fretibacter rubidus]|uniref:plastocyanin/azurin family copper-binding protein n=1 Tax=Fretibacter rubidus TaxID=570162 RepID=UPI00352A3348
MAAIFYPIGVLAQSKTEHVISQKNRTYAPGKIDIKTGESLKIVNDDIFLHHAFIDSEALEFDSGSMDEGEQAVVTFDTPGIYNVQCAIHPKMNLEVTVK